MSYTEYNITTVGSLTNNNGIISGFSTNNYASTSIDFNPSSNLWEVKLKIHIPDVSSISEQYLFQFNNNQPYNFVVGIVDTRFRFYASSNGSSWQVNQGGQHFITRDSDMWIKFGWSGTQYYLEYSYNNNEFARDITVNNSNSIVNTLAPATLGNFNNGNNPFTGSIDLNECYFKVNGVEQWKGVTNYYNLTINPTPADATVSINPDPSYRYPVYNISTVGHLTNNDGVLSNFSRSDYAKATTSFSPGDSSWEIGIKFVYTGDGNDYGTALEKTRNTWTGFRLQIDDGGHFSMFADIALTGTTVISANTTYWARFKYDGASLYTYELSTDGINYTIENTLTSSSKIFSSFTADTNIGYHASTGAQDRVWQGSIDLNECYFKVNGADQWRGVTYDSSPVYNISTVGSLTNNNGIISGFSNSNYAYSDPSFLPGTSPWEICIKFKPYSIHNGGLFNKIHNDYYGFRISAVPEGKIYYLVSSSSGQTLLFEGNGSHFYVLNQWNWVKFEWNGSVYNAYFSTDGENWELDKTFTSATRYYDDQMPTTIGCEPGLSRPFNGEIDLTECYFKINGVEQWRGVTPGQEIGYSENTAITYSVSKEGYQTQSDTFNITQDTVLNIVLQQLARNHIAIGNGELIKGYVGSNSVTKIYLGDILLYEMV